MRRFVPTFARVALLVAGAAQAHTGQGIQGRHAQGTDPPEAASPHAFGFVVATGLPHLAGTAFRRLTLRPLGVPAVRAAGVLFAAVGAAPLAGAA